MAPVDPITQPEAGDDGLDLEAFAWVARLASGEATRGDLARARDWRASDPARAAAWEHAVHVWRLLRPASEALRREGHAPQELPPVQATVWRRRAVMGGVGAAGAAACASLLLPLMPEYLADFRTARGQQRRIATAGGISVILNTGTGLDVRTLPGGGERIALLSGEIAVSARKGTSARIVVAAGDAEASIEAGRLDVRHDASATSFTCQDGVARLSCRGATASLAAGEQMALVDGRLSPPTAIDLEIVTAWERGLLIFHDAPLTQVIAEINRYRQGRILLLSEQLGHRLVNARLQTARLDDVVPLLRDALGARVRMLPGGLVLVS